MKRAAILDLGTNTFHLLLIEIENVREYNILFKAEKFVKLAEDGIHHIGDKAFARGISQLKEYHQVIKKYKPENIFAFGTAAFRNADNADKFIQNVLEETGIAIRKISGDEEAELICKGVRSAIPIADEPVLIMDIGGGSTEFIIANRERIFWKQSFPVGASVLKQRFHHSEPITENEIGELTTYLEQELIPLFNQSEKYPIHQFIGASGSFDSFASMVAGKFYYPEILSGKTFLSLKKEELISVFSQLKNSTMEERLTIKGLVSFRAEMIVTASVLTEVVLNHFSVTEIFQSAYALKEGVLSEMLSSK